MNRTIAPAVLLIGAGVTAAAAFAALTRQVDIHGTRNFDGAVRRRFPKRRRPLTKAAANAIGPLGKEFVHAPIALAVAGYIWARERRGAAAATLVLASLASTGTSRLFERVMKQRRPPPGRHSRVEPAFPSGHSLETTVVSLVAGYVLVREGLASAYVAAPIAAATPVISGAARLYLDRHWPTDVIGGWLAGLSLAAGCLALYETIAD